MYNIYPKITLLTLMFLQIIPTAYGCNGIALELDAKSFVSKIWQREPIKREDIQEKSYLIRDVDGLKSEAEKFPRLYENALSSSSIPQFVEFASLCKEVHDRGDLKTRIAVSMLFEKVSDQFLKLCKDDERKRRLEEQEDKKPKLKTSDEFLDYLANADKKPFAVIPDQYVRVGAH